MTPPPNKSEFHHTASNAGIIGLTAAGGAVVGFVLQLLVAYHFGAGELTDSYFMAQSSSELLSKLLMGGSITAVFIPLFVERLAAGRRADAWHLALNIFHLITAAYLLLLVAIAIFTDPFVRFIAPGFSPDQLQLTVQLLRVLLPSFFFLFLVEFFTSMLHSFRVFSLPALMRVVAPSISIISLLLLVSHLGIFALAVGVLAGSIVQFSLLLIGLKRQGLKYRFIFEPTSPTIKKLLRLVYPFIFSVLITQAAGIVYRILVSDLTPGSLASLKFAEKITQLLNIVFLNSVTLVIYPLLAQKAATKDITGMRDTIGSALRLIFFITLPVIIGISLLREDVIAVAYARGSFSATDAAMTSIALLYLVIGITTNGLSSTLGYTVLAFQKTKISVIITITSQIAAILLFLVLVPPLAHAGLALASSLVPLVSSSLYFLYLRRRIPDLHHIFAHSTYLKTVSISLALAALVIVLKSAPLASINSTVRLASISVLGGAFYFLSAYLLKIPEMHQVLAIAQGKLAKWQGNRAK